MLSSSRRVVLIGAASVLTLALAPLGRQQPARAPRLFKDSRQMMAIARAQGRTSMVFVVATLPGRTAAAANEATRLGGEVRFRDDSVGYLRVRMPLERATAFSESPDVEAVAADMDDSFPTRLGPVGAVPIADASRGDVGLLQGAQQGWPPRAGEQPLTQPYHPLDDVGGATMRREHPTWDGRGVTIALLDGNMDMLLPEYQTAYALDGTRIPKFADYLNLSDPRDDAKETPQWVDMHKEVDASGGRAVHEGKTFTVPADGRFRIGLFDERRFNVPANIAYIDQDVDRSGNPPGDDGLFGVLWNEATNSVWVDTDRDLDFTDEKELTDYARRKEFGVFGRDKPETPVREAIGFAVQTDRANKFISLNIGTYQHATMIMGAVAGNPDPGGRVRGIAPGARIASMYYGGGVLHGAIEGLIRTFRHPEVDVIVFEQNVFMASVPYLLGDGHHPLSVIVGRLTRAYGKLMFVPCGNAPGMAIASEEGVGPEAMCVGGYQSRESYLANLGTIVEKKDNLHWGALSHGPSGTGALKPDLMAPSGQVSTDLGIRMGAAIKGLYRLPSGYAIDGGTSTATPMAAGSAALVISAAKQLGLRYDAARLRAALTGSARAVDGLAAHEQGNGLVQVEAAVRLLQQLQGTPVMVIESSAPVHTALGGLTTTPGRGEGLYEREGWVPGESGERTVTLTRTSGPRGAVTVATRWLGNDGTFNGPESVTLPLDVKVQVVVRVSPATAGVHSAILELSLPSAPAPVKRVLFTVIAAEAPSASNGWTISQKIHVPRGRDTPVFLRVPPGATVLSLSAMGAPVRVTAVTPTRDYRYPCSFVMGTTPCSVSHPEPGVWEVNVSANDFFNYSEPAPGAEKPIEVTITARALQGSVRASGSAEWMHPGGNASGDAELMSTMAAVSSARVTGGMGSAYRAMRPIAQGEQHGYEVQVPKGATSLSATVLGEGGDLDVYLMDCTSSTTVSAYDRASGGKAPTAPAAPCTPRAKAIDLSANGHVEVANPAAGRWVVVVDGWRAPPGGTTYRYVDVVTHPRFGSVAAGEGEVGAERGMTWHAAFHAWAAAAPASPRTLVARLSLTSPEVFEPLQGPDGATRRYLSIGEALVLPGGSVEQPSRGAGGRGP